MQSARGLIARGLARLPGPRTRTLTQTQTQPFLGSPLPASSSQIQPGDYRFYRRGRAGMFPPGSTPGEEGGDSERGKEFFGMKVEGFDFDPREGRDNASGRGNFSARKQQQNRLNQGMTPSDERGFGQGGSASKGFYQAFKFQVIDVNRTFKVTKGGGEISFTALAICGNGKGVAGFGKGKGLKASDAVRKACKTAMSNLHYFDRYKGHTVYDYIEAKYGKTKVRLWPEWSTGLFRAGNLVYSILTLAGFSAVKSKLIGNSHPHNTVKATFLALSKIKTPEEVRKQFWSAVVERHCIVDPDGKPSTAYGKSSPWAL